MFFNYGKKSGFYYGILLDFEAYDQIKGKLTVMNRQGKPLEWSQPLTVIFAYEEAGQLIPVAKGGPLRIAIVGPGNPITQGKLWVKWVERIEIEEVASEKFTF